MGRYDLCIGRNRGRRRIILWMTFGSNVAVSGRTGRRSIAPVRFTPVAGARVGSRKAAPGSATVDVRPASPTDPLAAHRSAYMARAVAPSVVLAFERTRSWYRPLTERNPADD